MNLYRIADWDSHFENNRTRELKSLQWVPFPNRHDGDGYTELMDHKDGAAHFGAWVAIVQVASKCDVRGTLSRQGARPHDTASLARITRIPKRVLDSALKRLIEIGWIEVSQVEDNTYAISQEGATLEPQEGAALTEGNGREKKGKEKNTNEASEFAEAIYSAYPRKVGKAEALRAIAKACRDHNPEWLLERTEAFAASPAGQSGKYTPYPATWFNAGRYEDDDAEWSRADLSDSHHKPKLEFNDPTEEELIVEMKAAGTYPGQEA